MIRLVVLEKMEITENISMKRKNIYITKQEMAIIGDNTRGKGLKILWQLAGNGELGQRPNTGGPMNN